MKQTSFILLVDDEDEMRLPLREALQLESHHVTPARNALEARQVMKNSKYDLAILDVNLPDGNGLDLLAEFHASSPDMGFIMITGFANVDMAVETVRLGADDFLRKPFSLDELLIRVDAVLKKRRLQSRLDTLSSREKIRQSSKKFIGQSQAIRKVLTTVELINSSDSTVLITGETGTGKEVIAKAIHDSGSRSDMPFVSINCGAIPEELLESELFGHVKGAFTGAIHARTGRFERANKGTIFLDEIGDMSLKLQVKLLRILQERCFEPVGGNQTINIDVRVIAATHQNLEKLIMERMFREDLYYRLNVIPIQLPPLRERGEDIFLIADHFIRHFNHTRGSSIEGLSEETRKILSSYNWPGNVREIQNLIERIATLKREGQITRDDLPDRMLNSGQRIAQNFNVDFSSENRINLKGMVDEYENQLILSTLKRFDQNKTKAAHFLSMNRTTLVEKIKSKSLMT